MFLKLLAIFEAFWRPRNLVSSFIAWPESYFCSYLVLSFDFFRNWNLERVVEVLLFFLILLDIVFIFQHVSGKSCAVRINFRLLYVNFYWFWEIRKHALSSQLFYGLLMYNKPVAIVNNLANSTWNSTRRPGWWTVTHRPFELFIRLVKITLLWTFFVGLASSSSPAPTFASFPIFPSLSSSLFSGITFMPSSATSTPLHFQGVFSIWVQWRSTLLRVGL